MVLLAVSKKPTLWLLRLGLNWRGERPSHERTRSRMLKGQGNKKGGKLEDVSVTVSGCCNYKSLPCNFVVPCSEAVVAVNNESERRASPQLTGACEPPTRRRSVSETHQPES